jgi:hypothetical protein
VRRETWRVKMVVDVEMVGKRNKIHNINKKEQFADSPDALEMESTMDARVRSHIGFRAKRATIGLWSMTYDIVVPTGSTWPASPHRAAA